MSLSQNVKAIQIAVNTLNEDAKAGRNAVLRKYYNQYPREVQENITFLHGTQVYRDKTLEKFLQLIDKRPIGLRVTFAGGDDNRLLASVANEISDAVFAKALTVSKTGFHLASLTMFMREIGRSQYFMVTGRIQPQQIFERAVISIVAVAEYANTLEMLTQGGILYHVAQQYRRKYQGQIAVAYDYISGSRLGLKGGTFPRIQIGFYGNERPVIVRRGRKARRHAPI